MAAELHPASEEELAAIIRDAAGGGQPLDIRGGGTRNIGHEVSGDVLHLGGLSGITLYEPEALTLVARAGTPLGEIETALDTEGQQLAFEPWDARALTGSTGTPTIGGAVAVNASGPRRLQAGACRDSLIGVRFVDGTGAAAKNGGRVMKNVTGIDLVKLMAGSHGTLGVLAEVSFKLLPKPETTRTLVFDGLDNASAVAVMTAAMSAPFDVTGAAHLPAGPDGGPVTMLRLEGFDGSTEYRAGELARTLRDHGPARVVEGAGGWAGVRDAASLGGREGAVWRISVKPADGARLGAALGPAELIFDWAGGLVWALVPEDFDLRAAMKGFGGHATLIRASAETRQRRGVFHPEPAPVAAISAGLRSEFDPKGILNPGRMGARA